MTEVSRVPSSVSDFVLAKLSEGLTEIEKRRLFQFFFRLLNGSPRAWHLVDRFDSGAIDGDTFWELIE